MRLNGYAALSAGTKRDCRYEKIWGQRHLDYLKQYRRVTYTNLLTSGKLNTYLPDIDKQAQERFERLIEGMKQNGTAKGRKRLRMGRKNE